MTLHFGTAQIIFFCLMMIVMQIMMNKRVGTAKVKNTALIWSDPSPIRNHRDQDGVGLKRKQKGKLFYSDDGWKKNKHKIDKFNECIVKIRLLKFQILLLSLYLYLSLIKHTILLLFLYLSHSIHNFLHQNFFFSVFILTMDGWSLNSLSPHQLLQCPGALSSHHWNQRRLSEWISS